ncbi:MAG: transcriptional repressor [Candidatus Pacebacteria bacterium]|nr:transcriptional repressor [Candidatus Paceibacterota bacterium]
MKKKTQFDAALALRAAGLKATPRRLALLAFIIDNGRPLSAAMISDGLEGAANAVTVYRTLETLCRAGITKRIDFQHGRAYYELADTGDHHHIVCITCATVEDFSGCDALRITRNALRNSKGFVQITRHSLELFGVCKSCSVK